MRAAPTRRAPSWHGMRKCRAASRNSAESTAHKAASTCSSDAVAILAVIRSRLSLIRRKLMSTRPDFALATSSRTSSLSTNSLHFARPQYLRQKVPCSIFKIFFSLHFHLVWCVQGFDLLKLFVSPNNTDTFSPPRPQPTLPPL
jgi:hypothetical protein